MFCMKTIGEQAQEFRLGMGWSPQEMAAAVSRHHPDGKVSRQVIEQLEKASRRRPRYITALAKVMGTTVEALEAGAFSFGATPIEIDLSDNPEYPAIRRVRFKLSAGASGFGVEYLQGEGPPIVFQRAWYESRGFKPENLFAVKVANGSMEPGLFDGDTVVVNTAQTTQRDGVVFAVNYEGEMVVKRLVRDAGQWWLSSDNPDQRRYPRKVCHEDTFILGEIVHKQSERI